MTLKLLVATGSAVIALAGCASTAPHPTSTAAAEKIPCPTASHLPQGTAPCVSGRTYTGTDLDRTGEINPAEALQRLDPSITVERR